MSTNSETFDLNSNTVDNTFASHSEDNVINNNSSSTSSTSTSENDELLTKFDDDNLLDDDLLRGIAASGWSRPSQIQQRVIPVLLNNYDILAQAQSGRGKTGAFSISAIQKLLTINDNNSKVLILSPTKELAEQTSNIIKDLGQFCENIMCNKFTGGVNKRIDIENINNGTNILCGTPGRVLDLSRTKYLKPNDIVLCIIDEADEMLDRNFRDDLYKIVTSLNEEAQVALISATVPNQLKNLSGEILNENRKKIITVKNSELTLEGIEQKYVLMGEDVEKFSCLDDIFTTGTVGQIVIFCSTKERVDYLVNYMREKSHTVDSIHGNMSQEERQTAMRNFRSGGSRVLISTDLIARGIDVQQVSIVFNFDMPKEMENYIHRIGRSGRYGRKGLAISFVLKDELGYLKEIENFYHTEISELLCQTIFGEN